LIAVFLKKFIIPPYFSAYIQYKKSAKHRTCHNRHTWSHCCTATQDTASTQLYSTDVYYIVCKLSSATSIPQAFVLRLQDHLTLTKLDPILWLSLLTY